MCRLFQAVAKVSRAPRQEIGQQKQPAHGFVSRKGSHHIPVSRRPAGPLRGNRTQPPGAKRPDAVFIMRFHTSRKCHFVAIEKSAVRTRRP